jgi:hypothetical protein
MIKHILPRYAGIDRATCEKLQRTGRPVVAMRLIVRGSPRRTECRLRQETPAAM